MKNLWATLFFTAGFVSFAVAAQSQSLAQVANKEKSRRADNARSGKQPRAVVDEHALRNVYAPTFANVQVEGAAKQPSAPAAELGRPAPKNPNRAAPTPKPKTTQSTPGSPNSTRSIANTDTSKGWSKDRSNTTNMRGAPAGTKAIHPTTVRERDRNKNRHPYRN